MNKYNSSYNPETLWNIVELHLDTTTKCIYKLKFSPQFNQIRTNHEISLLLGCSEESILKLLHRSQEVILQEMYKI